ncbi:MAG: c-type cytochrome [Thiomicrorhabdus sp.]|nr:c-type cytochrome [Thiomicrorhabdus sp.]
MTILLKNKAPYILSCVLLSSAVLLSAGCSNEGADGAAENAPSGLLEKTAAAATGVVDDAKNAVEKTTDAVNTVVAETKTAVVETTDKAVEVVSDVKTAVVETTDKAATVVSDAKDAIVEKTDAVKQAVVSEKKVSVPAVDGAKIYASCSGCHGANAEGGVGPNLNAQTASDVADKLNRYKAGEQIGPMSGMMTPIAKGLSDAEIKAVAGYVVTLK